MFKKCLLTQITNSLIKPCFNKWSVICRAQTNGKMPSSSTSIITIPFRKLPYTSNVLNDHFLPEPALPKPTPPITMMEINVAEAEEEVEAEEEAEAEAYIVQSMRLVLERRPLEERLLGLSKSKGLCKSQRKTRGTL